MSGSNQVEQLLAAWGLQARRFEKVQDVYKVETDQGLMNLKVSPLIPKRLLFVHQAVRHLAAQGFAHMNPLIPTPDGRSYLCDDQYAYTLYRWVPGRQCDFRNRDELTRATQILAQFHRKSAGFNPPYQSSMRNRLGKCLRQFEERRQELIEYQELAQQRRNEPFARIYLENVEYFLPMAVKAIARLRGSAYPLLVEKAFQEQTFCHGDPAARNFILTPQNEIFVIDFDSCRVDLPIMDVIKFTRRVLKKHRWRTETAIQLINAYHAAAPLTPAELAVMKSVFYFPQKFWRMSTRYFHEHGRHSPERALEKFQKYLRNKKSLAQFQTEFDDYQLPMEKAYAR